MTNKKKCEDCQKYQEKAFELEVDEDLQQERLHHFWKKYGWMIYAGVVVILALTAGIQIYQSWKMKVRLAESDQFETAVIKIFSQKPDEARPLLNELADSGRTGYRYLAQLELAGLAARQNDQEAALVQLKKLMDDSSAPETLRTAALLSYVGYQADTGDPKELLQMLEPVMENAPFIGTTMQLVTVLYLRDNQPELAKQKLKNALNLPNITEAATQEIKMLMQIVENN